MLPVYLTPSAAEARDLDDHIHLMNGDTDVVSSWVHFEKATHTRME